MEEPFAKHKRTNSNLNVLSDRPKRPRHDSDGDDGIGDSGRNAPASITSLPPEAYTVGWICALSIERAAAEAILDEEHGPLPAQPWQDSNSYTLGRIGLHNIVIASLPAGHFGLNNATTVANHMLWSFPHIDQRLVVGIGGGAPDLKDIRLGDVVVSSQVIQNDFGKAVPDGNFQITSVPTRPPPILLNTVATLQAKHNRLQSQIPAILERVFQRYPHMGGCKRPTADDILFKYSYNHVLSPQGTCDSCDRQYAQARPQRLSTNPVIHIGKVASANQVMRDGAMRKQRTEELSVDCFEMEAAGLMDDSISCLVIRGICDYSDSHKNKAWQEYAAAVAAAYATELLHLLPTRSSRYRPTSTYEADAPSLRRDQTGSWVTGGRREQLLESLNFEELDSRHINIKDALKRTCNWFLSDEYYHRWLDPKLYSEHHGFLWVSGKPGSGKSTLMKFIYSNMKKAKKQEPETAVVAFFFNARGVELERSTPGLYRSLIFQILNIFPVLQDMLDAFQAVSVEKHTGISEHYRAYFRTSLGLLDNGNSYASSMPSMTAMKSRSGP